MAKLLSKVVEEQPQLVILGKQSIDSDNNQTGQMLAALTGMPQGICVEVVVDSEKVNVTRVIDGGLQTVAASSGSNYRSSLERAALHRFLIS